MMVRWSGEVQVSVRWMSGECQVNVKSQSELDIGGRETCLFLSYLHSCSHLLYSVFSCSFSNVDVSSNFCLLLHCCCCCFYWFLSVFLVFGYVFFQGVTWNPGKVFKFILKLLVPKYIYLGEKCYWMCLFLFLSILNALKLPELERNCKFSRNQNITEGLTFCKIGYIQHCIWERI